MNPLEKFVFFANTEFNQLALFVNETIASVHKVGQNATANSLAPPGILWIRLELPGKI